MLHVPPIALSGALLLLTLDSMKSRAPVPRLRQFGKRQRAVSFFLKSTHKRMAVRKGNEEQLQTLQITPPSPVRTCLFPIPCHQVGPIYRAENEPQHPSRVNVSVSPGTTVIAAILYGKRVEESKQKANSIVRQIRLYLTLPLGFTNLGHDIVAFGKQWE